MCECGCRTRSLTLWTFFLVTARSTELPSVVIPVTGVQFLTGRRSDWQTTLIPWTVFPKSLSLKQRFDWRPAIDKPQEWPATRPWATRTNGGLDPVALTAAASSPPTPITAALRSLSSSPDSPHLLRPP
jgi:hypothetical protein